MLYTTFAKKFGLTDNDIPMAYTDFTVFYPPDIMEAFCKAHKIKYSKDLDASVELFIDVDDDIEFSMPTEVKDETEYSLDEYLQAEIKYLRYTADIFNDSNKYERMLKDELLELIPRLVHMADEAKKNLEVKKKQDEHKAKYEEAVSKHTKWKKIQYIGSFTAFLSPLIVCPILLLIGFLFYDFPTQDAMLGWIFFGWPISMVVWLIIMGIVDKINMKTRHDNNIYDKDMDRWSKTTIGAAIGGTIGIAGATAKHTWKAMSGETKHKEI